MPEEQQYEESTIFDLLSQDSEYAFQLIFDRYRNRIYQLAMLYVKSPAIAEEIVQDTFLKLWFQRKNLASIRSFEPWLFTVCKNCTLNYLKKIANEWKAREKWKGLHPLSANTTDHKLLNAQYDELLFKAVARLPTQQQHIYRLAKEQGMSYDAIGQKLSLSPLTVKTHMTRALRSVRDFFSRHGEIFMLSAVLSISTMPAKHIYFKRLYAGPPAEMVITNSKDNLLSYISLREESGKI